MVLLFWAHLLSSNAHATIVNFVDCSGPNNCTYEPPPTTAGPVIEKMKDHFCTGSGEPLYLPKEVIYSDAFKREMRIRNRERRRGWIWIGGQSHWGDNTIFADLPFKLSVFREQGIFVGIMNNSMAGLLDVHCDGDAAPVKYNILVQGDD
jgi:hypothetical protein